MCLGIPARVVSCDAEGVAMCDVSGAVRPIGTGMLDEGVVLAPGEWVLVHMGFAMERISEADAAAAVGSLEMLGAEPVTPAAMPDWTADETPDAAPPGWSSW
jgi:hydrogenase expression/formation protein HypC